MAESGLGEMSLILILMVSPSTLTLIAMSMFGVITEQVGTGII